MKRRQWISYILGIIAVESVGALAALLSAPGIMDFGNTVSKPALTPPAWVFPVVWAILYAFMGVGLARVWNQSKSGDRNKALNLFVVQLVLNFFWSLIFFRAKAYGLAVIWLLVLWSAVVVMIFRFRKVDTTAALLQLPYLLWLTAATYLAIGVWVRNS